MLANYYRTHLLQSPAITNTPLTWEFQMNGVSVEKLPLVLIDLADQKESETFPLRLSEGSYVSPYELGLCKYIIIEITPVTIDHLPLFWHF